MEKITSLNNNRIKGIVKLNKASERKAQGLIVIEGLREIQMAINSNFEIQEIYICPELLVNEGEKLIEKLNCQKFEVSTQVFEKIAYRIHSDGLIAISVPKYLNLSKLKLSEKPLIVVLEAVEKPGNLGAILRTSDAAGVDAILICDPQTDIYNPNVIRSSLGCIFSKQVVTCTSEDAIQFFRKNQIEMFAAALTNDNIYFKADFTKSSAIILGTEADGLSEVWLKQSDNTVKIPMLGSVDSLNVSVSAAILIFEAVKQRIK